MSAKEEFENQFGEEVFDLLILTKEAVGSGVVVRKTLQFAASVDLKTGVLSQEKGILTWMVKKKRKNRGYKFRQFEIYHIRARKYISNQRKAWNNRYLLLKVVKKQVSEPRLDAIREYLKQPVIIEDAVGKFVLNRQFSWFESNIDWLGVPCDVILNSDGEDGETAEKALDTLHMLYADLKNWDHRFRAYASKKMQEYANDLLLQCSEEGEAADPITVEDFARRITINMIAIQADGSITVY
ncbi:MAG: DUF2262 domain-containing protein, partial [Oscillospiraceae bacterium]|nr:DUF2262 domain-containing protein [Oscillospiraceae bacterium]